MDRGRPFEAYQVRGAPRTRIRGRLAGKLKVVELKIALIWRLWTIDRFRAIWSPLY